MIPFVQVGLIRISCLSLFISIIVVSRASWGATADYMSFNIPIGEP